MNIYLNIITLMLHMMRCICITHRIDIHKLLLEDGEQEGKPIVQAYTEDELHKTLGVLDNAITDSIKLLPSLTASTCNISRIFSLVSMTVMSCVSMLSLLPAWPSRAPGRPGPENRDGLRFSTMVDIICPMP